METFSEQTNSNSTNLPNLNINHVEEIISEEYLKPLSQKTIVTIKGSAHLITEKAEEITSEIYLTLFLKFPDMQKLFKNAPNHQYAILAEAISAYAVNIDCLYKLEPALKVIAETHVRENVQAIHYPILGIIFIQALENALKEKATIELLDAWREAYKYISGVLINMENKLRGK